MKGPMGEAFAEMAALEKGAIANPDEKRMVGHYWLRAPALAPTAELREAIEETQAPRQAVRRRRSRAARFDRRNARTASRTFSSIGIGGSALGPQFVADALGTAARAACSRTSSTTPIPTASTACSSRLGDRPRRDARRRHLEVRRHQGDAQRHARGQGGFRRGRARLRRARRRRHAATAASSIEYAASERLARALPDVGLGRRPHLGAVRGRPAARRAAGPRHRRDARRRARRMDAVTRRREPRRESRGAPRADVAPRRRTAAARRTWSSCPTRIASSSSAATCSSSSWNRSARSSTSTARVVNQGIAVYGNKGSTDQHAYVQQLRDGVQQLLRHLHRGAARPRRRRSLEVEPGVTSAATTSNGFLLGTRQALLRKRRASRSRSRCRTSTRATVGALIALYERAVGLYASLVEHQRLPPARRRGGQEGRRRGNRREKRGRPRARRGEGRTPGRRGGRRAGRRSGRRDGAPSARTPGEQPRAGRDEGSAPGRGPGPNWFGSGSRAPRQVPKRLTGKITGRPAARR